VNVFTFTGEDAWMAGETSKSEQTRRRIFETALSLFVSQGYHGTTLREIARQAECSLGLSYRYFAGKEELVLALYEHLAGELEERLRALPAVPLAAGFPRAMRVHFALLAPYRPVFGEILGAAMNPRSEVGVLGRRTTEVRGRVRRLFAQVVGAATDAPREPQAGRLAIVLYGAHLAMVLFWLLDRTPECRATDDLLVLARELLTWIRPVLGVRWVARSMERLANAIAPVLGHGTEG
jgi:AcrR family transcriptional regulator